jgi:hypothetical protein
MTKELIQELIDECLYAANCRGQAATDELEEALKRIVSKEAWGIYLDLEAAITDEYYEALEEAAERLAEHVPMTGEL